MCEKNKLSMNHDCSICITKFELGNNVVQLKCDKTHIFHKGCLTQWTAQSYTCPICREPIISQLEDIEAYKQLARLNQLGQFEDNLAEGEMINNIPEEQNEEPFVREGRGDEEAGSAQEI